MVRQFLQTIGVHFSSLPAEPTPPAHVQENRCRIDPSTGVLVAACTGDLAAVKQYLAHAVNVNEWTDLKTDEVQSSSIQLLLVPLLATLPRSGTCARAAAARSSTGAVKLRDTEQVQMKTAESDMASTASSACLPVPCYCRYSSAPRVP
jgi:hypothetical protein